MKNFFSTFKRYKKLKKLVEKELTEEQQVDKFWDDYNNLLLAVDYIKQIDELVNASGESNNELLEVKLKGIIAKYKLKTGEGK